MSRRRRRAAKSAAALTALGLAACFSLPGAERRERLETLLGEPTVPVVVDPSAHLAFVRVAGALTFSTGFEAGERLRAEFGLPTPARGFAEAFVAALRERPRFASAAYVQATPAAASPPGAGPWRCPTVAGAGIAPSGGRGRPSRSWSRARSTRATSVSKPTAAEPAASGTGHRPRAA